MLLGVKEDDRNALRLREKYGDLLKQAKAINSQCKDENREPTASESAVLENILDHQIPQVKAEIAAAEKVEADMIADFVAERQGGNLEPLLDNHTLERHKSTQQPQQWIDAKTGEKIHCLAPGQKLADIDAKATDEPLSVGRYIQARLTNNWKHAQAELRAAQSEGDNMAGGNLVPSQLGRQVIDLARARSVLMQAGMQTIPMESDRLTIGRVSQDPTFEVKSENAAFTEDDIVFDNLGFTAYTVGQVIRASKELAMDAPNFPILVENLLANSLAAEIDRLALRGSGSQEPVGILNKTGIGSTSSVGAIVWEDMNTGVVDILNNNESPNAYVINPTIYSDLTMLTTGDGTNAAKGWLPAPPLVAPLTPYMTTNITTGDVLIGDFTQALMAVRTQVDIQMSDVAEDFFKRYQTGFRIVMRFDINIARAGAFHALNDVTT